MGKVTHLETKIPVTLTNFGTVENTDIEIDKD